MDRTIIRLIIFAILLTSLQGSILCIQSFGIIKLCGEQYHKMQLLLLKWSTVALLLPVAFLVLVVEQMDLNSPFIIYHSAFLVATKPQAARVYSVLAVVWLAGVVCHAVVTLIPRYRLHCLRKSCIPVTNESWQALLEEYRLRLGTHRLRKIALSQSYRLRSPITVGIFRPEIILPVQNYTMAQMHMILEHEINHIQNRDLLWKRICLAAEGLHWFNPLVRLLTGKVIYLEEVICDRQSVENTSAFSVKDYGRFLADMEDNQIGESAVAALCESRNIVVRRIRLLANENRKLLPGRFVFPACLALLLSCTMFLSHTAAVYAAEWSNISMYGTSGGISEGGTKESAEAEMIYGIADASVTEKDLSAEYTEDPFKYDGVLEAKTRYLVFIAQMPEGAGIGLMYKSEEREMVRAGLKNLSTGEVAYEEAGYGGYSYTVPAAGTYAVYIENIQDHALNGFLSGYYSE
ncbi:MAG: M56 family metallopeptidase [Bacteroidales bacterium]|nr:M56 family metallopeptidase [Lachnoclostridium sp.]MCM1384140.1 M56 family metallopeptidase [Lachnoclostridium sp.]MCM1464806.1 M56 family metallopeptidase [Bacteroidales bacterium]